MKGIIERIEEAERKSPDKPAFIVYRGENRREISYRALMRAVKSVALDLREGGITGKRCILFSDNSPEWCTAYLGIHYAGNTVIPVDAGYGEVELRNIISFSKPARIYYDSSKKVLPPDVGVPAVRIEEIYNRVHEEKEIERIPLGDDFPASIIFTSGTTGEPKGVLLPERCFIANLDGIRAEEGMVLESDRVLLILPLHHVYAFTCAFLATVTEGATLVFPRSLKGTDITDVTRNEKITVMLVVPQVLNQLHRRIFERVDSASFIRKTLFGALFYFAKIIRPLAGPSAGRILFASAHENFPALRYTGCGGAKLDERINRELSILGFRIVEAYGLTETAPLVCLNTCRRQVPGSVGKPLKGTEVRLEKIEGFEDGEICVRGPNVMQGYLDRPEDTQKVLKDGWFHTGDLGRFDSEGNLYITGRLKDVIVLPSGKNIYPEELEKIYSKARYVKEICILHYRDNLTAVIYPDYELLTKNKAGDARKELTFFIQDIASKLPSYQRVTRIEIVNQELPKTRLGKIQRHRVMKEIELQEKAKVVSQKELSSSGDPLYSLLIQHLNLTRLPDENDSLDTDLGMDSLTKLEFLTRFEEKFGVKVPEDEIIKIMKVKDLRKYTGEIIAENRAEAVDIMDEVPASSQGPGFLMDGKNFPPLESVVESQNPFYLLCLKRILFFLLWLVLKIFFRAEIRGLEHLEGRRGPFILAPNHCSYIDPVVILALLPFEITKELYFLSLPQLFERFPLSLIRKPGRVIMTGTASTSASSLYYSVKILRDKAGIMCIFPEGKRSSDGRVEEPQRGFGMIVTQSGAAVIPVYISGTIRLFSRPVPGLSKTKIICEILPELNKAGDEMRLLSDWKAVMRMKNLEEFDRLS